MKKLFTLLFLAASAAAMAQNPGDIPYSTKNVGGGFTQRLLVPSGTALVGFDGSGLMVTYAQNLFATASHTHTASQITDFNSVGDARWSLLAHTHTFASLTSKPTTLAGYGITDAAALVHTHVSAAITDASTGGNTTADADLLAKYNSEGQLRGSVNNSSTAAVWGSSTGSGYGGLFTGSGQIMRLASPGGALDGSSVTVPVLVGFRNDAGNIMELTTLFGGSFYVGTDGVLDWSSGSAAQGTADNLPEFGVNTRGLVDGPGSVTGRFLRDDGSWDTPAGTGVTNVTASTPVASSGGTTPNISIADAAADGSTKGAATFTAADFNATSGNISLDYTNGQAASASNKGFLTSADWSTFNTKAPRDATYITQTANSDLTNEQALGSLTTGLVKVTTTTGVLSTAAAGTDYVAVDNELTAVASTTSAANKIIQYTGSGTATTQDFKVGTEVAYTGTITWTAGAAPSGASSLRQFYTQIGTMVSWQISLTYANAGTTVTNVVLTFPTEFPTPATPTGFSGASVYVWNCASTRLFSTPSGTLTNAGGFMVRRNSGDTAFEISSAAFTSGTYRTFIFSGTYFTQ